MKSGYFEKLCVPEKVCVHEKSMNIDLKQYLNIIISNR